MLAALLALGLAAVAQGDSIRFEGFAFHYETGWGDRIDTSDGTIARDNCGHPPGSGRAKLSKREMRAVYGRLVALRAFDLPEPCPPIEGKRCLTEPSTSHDIDLHAGTTVRHFHWVDAELHSCEPGDAWLRLLAVEALLDSTLHAQPAYRRLPHRTCDRF